jgi:pimeloyl-ACP methyl ester carboxylesterase
MNRLLRSLFLLGVSVVLMGCGNVRREGLKGPQLASMEAAFSGTQLRLSRQTEDVILALNPTNVTSTDVREVLAGAPAPRVVKIHGGVAKVIPMMVSFSDFLQGLGYPVASLTNPGDGTYTFSCYESSEKIAGVIAWFYEKEGLRPVIVGHSQGGIQAVKVLGKLAQKSSTKLHVWSPLTWQEEQRCAIQDPVTGKERPVVGLRLPYVTVVGSGGLTRLLPNQWDMNFRLHTVPDTVEEFTGFCKGGDLLGGDFLGYGSANYFKASGAAVVRNVWLPTEYKHGEIPDTKHLLKDQNMVDWINRYRPSPEPVSRPVLDVRFAGDSSNILWAAEVWYHIKKHWVLELQRAILARRARETAS